MSSLPEVEILLPVHNEAESIEATLREIFDELSAQVSVGFLICEDGSKDRTRDILTGLAQELPLRLNLSAARKGYSRAVREGMQMLHADYLLCLDSDGQCDPRDFWSFWSLRSDYDLIIGWRVKRADTLLRRTLSGFFFVIYQTVFRIPVHDPSCPFVLVKKTVAHEIVGKLGTMKEGFWWEFVARLHRGGYRIKELPVHHRLRVAGVTQVYKWKKMPGIFVRHVAGIFRIWAETRR
jgi:dolichol-phosphate mannosyltransferase